MNKYKLIQDLCESRIFRTRQSSKRFSDDEQQKLFYSVLLATIALALDTKTQAWAQKYASQTAAFSNFDYFRISGTDLYVLTYLAQNENNGISRQTSRKLLRIYKGLGRGNIERSFVEQTLLRLERSLNIHDTRLRNARRVIAHWGTSTPIARKSAITQLHRSIRTQAKLAEVLPYLLILTKGEKGHFGKSSVLKKVAAIAGAGLAGLALGLRHDPNKRWSVFKNSAVFDGEKMLKEDRPTQLFHILQNLNHHPDIERVISVNYLSDGMSAFVRTTDGNAYELEIRPAPFAKGHKEKRGVKEGAENPLAKFGITALSDIIEQGDIGYSDDPVYMYWVEVPNRGSSGYFSFIEDAYALAREDYPYLIDDEDINESGWQWRCVNIINEHDKRNYAAVIALTPDDLDHKDSHKNGKHDGPDTEEEVYKYLKSVRDRYDVEIVDDFLKYTGQEGKIT